MMRDDTDNIILTTVLTDYINQVSTNDVSNYAFEMEEIENDTDYFLNLVVKEYNDSYYISIVKYVPDPLWFSLNTRSQDFSSYTGNTYFYDEQGVYLANMEFTNGAASSFGYNPPCPDSDSANYLGDWIGDNFPGGDGAGLGGLPCITTWYSCNGPNADISHDEGPNSGLVGDISCGDASSGYSGSGWTMDCGDGDSGYDGTASTWDNVFNDYLSNSCGSLGSGGGNNTPLCPGVTPCIEEYQSFDANCNCVNNFNPITPINSSIYYAKEVNICLGRILTTDQLIGLDNNEDFTLAVHNYLVLDNGECDPTADTDFAKAAIDALMDGGEVDFDREIIIDATIPQCVKAIINQLISDDTFIDLGDMPDFVKQELNLSGFILNIFNNSENFKLIFNTGDLSTITPTGTTYKNAQTVPRADPNNPGKFIFTITIDESYISNATDLTIARTIIHETVHAYISYFYQNTPFSSLSFSLRHLLSQEGATDQTAQHMLMTTNFVSAISNSLANWDNNSISINNYYDYLSWSGTMLNTTTFNNMNTTFQQNSRNANIAEGQAGPNGGYNTSNAKGIKNCN